MGRMTYVGRACDVFVRRRYVRQSRPRIGDPPSVWPPRSPNLARRRCDPGSLGQRLDGLLSGMDHVVTTLQIVQAEILAHDGVEQRALASQVAELRDKVRILATGLEDSFAETRVH